MNYSTHCIATCFRFQVDYGGITYVITICIDASKSHPNSSVLADQKTSVAVLGRYNDTNVVGRGMKIRPHLIKLLSCIRYRCKILFGPS